MDTKIADFTPHKKSSGCGIQVLYNGVFGRRGIRPRRTVSTSSIPLHKITSFITNLKLRRAGSEVAALLDVPSNAPELPSKLEKPIVKTTLVNHTKTMSPHQRKPSSGTITTSTSSSSSNGSKTNSKVTSTPAGLIQRRLSRGSSTSEELDSLVTERLNEHNALVKASSGNIMPFSRLGSRRQHAVENSNSSKVHSVKHSTITISNNTSVMGNIVSKNLYKLDPDALKVMGNVEYKKGRFAVALTLYDRAISLNSDNASYRSNKSAALIGLGRLLEAIFECREAIRIDPFYRRAHHRLATLYIRLGEAESALSHFKQSGIFKVKSSEISKAQVLQSHINNCIEAKKLRDWNTMLKETDSAISLGADSALQIISLQAEALLKLHRHQDADSALMKKPSFDINDCTKFFGPTRNAQLLLIQAQVDVAAGRFDEGVVAAQQALRLDPSNKEMSCAVSIIRAVSSARSSGNKLFNASKFTLASVAYSEGLEHEPFNSVLLCNRAACRFKLGQYEKAMEDCTSAINLRPSYSKARLRRAECNAKMERWEASIQDYEILTRESPEDEKLGQALLKAQVQLKTQRDENNIANMKFSADVGDISFRHFVTSPTIYVDVQG
ncbi:Tpr repeat-containing thioredoxin ttl1 [Thalictrum thalictroides]|uniref:Tpr repeat-containing thioredoxin ttl1 n=1 Tax=Thalictrum thalictroides TaxID=46969 RepID=A0A7J6W2Q5_THATH|nr:Tpr repeat-containing thioredoxin ttl1 [Thalictrum thalictroides]